VLPLAAVVTVAIVGFAVRSNPGPGASSPPAPSDLLERVSADGVVHIAVSNAAPQTQTSGNAYLGFDVDVAKGVASWLGVRPDIQFAPPEEILLGNGGWELSFPSHALPDGLSGVLVGPRYYTWPAWLVVQAASSIDSIAALDGAAICVVEGSSGAGWLTGTSATDTTLVTSPPVGATIIQRASDQACIAAVATGDAEASVTGRAAGHRLRQPRPPRHHRIAGDPAAARAPWCATRTPSGIQLPSRPPSMQPSPTSGPRASSRSCRAVRSGVRT
jgi:ABC-type amino acid transport substrate-binding protein